MLKGDKINSAIKLLEAKGFITVRKNPNPRYEFDKTRFFDFHVEKVQEFIDSYDTRFIVNRTRKIGHGTRKNGDGVRLIGEQYKRKSHTPNSKEKKGEIYTPVELSLSEEIFDYWKEVCVSIPILSLTKRVEES